MGAYVKRRTGPRGVRWLVYYRAGGRETPERYDSSWPTKAVAQSRVEVILRAWAAGQPVPPVRGEPTASSPTVRACLDEYATTRVDVGEARHHTYHLVRGRLGDLDQTPVDRVTPAVVRAWIAGLSGAGLAPQTVRMYLSVLRQVLDHAEVEPNPARHASIRLPRMRTEEVQPPSTAEFHAMAEAITPAHQLALIVLEGTGLRVGELERATWGDLDLAGRRLRVRGTKTRNARRWVPL
ncbi:MAG: hypothetical protein U0Y82_16850, partial [Thermoleophilia bacterium]